jgi:hypothetical protein
MPITIRKLLPAVFAAVALLPSAALLLDALRVAGSSNAELVTRFNGAAFEDIFGFGFWFHWALFFVVEAAALTLVWLLAVTNWRRYLVPILLAAFAGTSLLGYQSFSREYALWSTQFSQ